MAISSETSSVSYAGNNSTSTAYTLAFPFSGAAELVVTHTTAAGVRATLAITTGYTLHGDYATGAGTLKTVAAIPVADTLLIERFTAATQALDSSSPAGSYPTSIETQLDRSTRALQDGKRIATRNFARSLRLPDGETAAELPSAASRKGEVLFFHATTGAVETKTPDEILALSGGAPDGIGIPAGGTTGQALVKTSGTSYAVQWGDVVPTAAQIVTGIESASTAQDAAIRSALEVQSTTIGFLDRFDYGTRYAANATLTHNSSLPEIGGTAYRIAPNGATRPKIVSGALEPLSDSLDYFANQVTTTGGKFSLGLVVEFSRTAVYATASNNGGFTVAIGDEWLVSSGGTITGLAAIEPLHITVRPDGISDASIYNGVATLTCLNATYAGGVFPWNSRNTQLPFGEKLAIIFRIAGDILEVEAVGVGSLYFTHADISTKVAATTYFFYEPVGPDLGSYYRQIARLYRWWANAEELNQAVGYGVTVPQVTGGPHRFPGQMQLYPNGRTARLANDSMPGVTTAAMVVTGTGNVTKGAYTRPTGGAVVLESQVVHNFGYNETSASLNGFMIGAVDTNLNAVVSSTAGAETNFSNAAFLPLWGAENADWQRWYWAGTLVGGGNKRIRLNLAFGGGDPGTPGNLIDSGTITTTGFYEIRLHRYTNSTASHTFYATMHANGVLVAATRTAWNGTTNYVTGSLKVTTADAGGVTLDTFTSEVARVNMT